MSQASRLTLIKSVLRTSTLSPKLHLLIWETLCLSRSKGRPGFKYSSWMNKAMLGKQFWRLAKQPNSILTRTLEAKYLPNNSLLDWNWCWKSIYSCKNLPLTLANWRVGSGQDIDKTPRLVPSKSLVSDWAKQASSSFVNYLRP